MNIAVLSRGSSLYSTKSIINAGATRNHAMEVLDPTYFTLSIENNKPVVRYYDEIIDDLDAIIPRIGASNTYLGSSVVRHFQSMGVFTVVSPEAILQSRDKWICTQILSKADVAVPRTFFGNATDFDTILSEFNKEPVIIKILEGTHGNGVILAETYKSALSTMQTLKTANVPFIVQEFIEESNGSDVRIIVIDGEVVAAMKRHSKDGDFRSNLHRGGSSEIIKLNHEEEHIAKKAAKALGLGICGVDILQSKNGPLVLEINSTPGLEGIETTTGINISQKMISYIERNKK
ncbi:MAG: RimK family alpha-L-glutamate ligase [Flavobacteriaceae bacterium]|nr:RimK family alpha-L-glutamate ligase [Flavobacteriaceae bacterium]